MFADVVDIYPTNAAANNWYWYDDTTDAPVTNSITQAKTPPGSLTGSIDMTMSGVNNRPWVFTTQFNGTALSNITSLLYETYSVSGSSGATLLEPTLQIGIGKTAADTAFEGRLVFDPSLIGGGTSAPAANTWTTWDALTSTGGWIFSRSVNVGGTNVARIDNSDPCVLGNSANTTSTCSLANILLRNPNLVVNSTGGAVGFRTGGSGVVETSYADMLTFGTAAGATTFDFTTPEPSTWSAMLLGFAGLLLVARKRRAASLV